MTEKLSQGVVFPVLSSGKRSTMRTGAEIFAAAIAPFDALYAKKALDEKEWRKAYPKYFRWLIESGIREKDKVVASAQAGLDAAWNAMRWDDGTRMMSLRDALESEIEEFETVEILGEGDKRVLPWSIPLNGLDLAGDILHNQISEWLKQGIIEPSAAEALKRCIAHPEWFDLSDRHIVLLGAGSEVGPLQWLMQWRANVIAVDIDREDVWTRLTALAKAGNGRMYVPVHAHTAIPPTEDWKKQAGANLITEAPSIAVWLKTFQKPLDIASLAYLDGERLMRVSLGMDMIVESLCAHDPATSLLYLATPTDVFAIHKETAESAMDAYKARSPIKRSLQAILNLLTGNRFFHPNVAKLARSDNGQDYGVSDSIVVQQGANYALAKRLQHWRGLVARTKGIHVSLNVTPSTTTISVTKNAALAAGFAGADSFGLEIFKPETTNALMAALWVHDLRYEGSAANPKNILQHPYELFMDNACHGGMWRFAYKTRTAIIFAAALGWFRMSKVGKLLHMSQSK